MEATVILARCPDTGELYGMRTERTSDGDWWRNWAFPVSARQANAEGYDRTQIRGTLRCETGYPGCPYCGAAALVQCGKCGRLSCWTGRDVRACPWCGVRMGDFQEVSEVRVSGGDM